MQGSKVMDWWPLYAAIAGGLIAWGTLNADVTRMRTDIDAQKSDHDLVVELRAEQRHIANDVSEIKQTVKELANDRTREDRTAASAEPRRRH